MHKKCLQIYELWILQNQAVFQSSDTGFIIKQIKSYKYFQWDTTIKDNRKIVYQSIIDTIFNNSKEVCEWRHLKALRQEEFYRLSLGFLLPTRIIVLLKINRSCGSLGMLCKLKRRTYIIALAIWGLDVVAICWSSLSASFLAEECNLAFSC